MSLARVIVPVTDFDAIYSHLISHNPRYRNMHMREARYRQKKRVLRHFHAMYAHPGVPARIEGMFSGPDVFLHYELVKNRSRTQMNVFEEKALPADLDRIESKFLTWILDRVRMEQAGMNFTPDRIRGQLYLERNHPGSSVNHPECKRAVADATLAPRFVAQLAPWGLRLWRK